MEKKKTKTKMTHEEAQVFHKHMKAIQQEYGKLQQYLNEIGIRPVGGWTDPVDFVLAKGIKVSELVAKDGCTECMVVCFDDPCDCTECGDDRKEIEDRWDKVSFRALPADTNILIENVQTKGIRLHMRRK